MRVTKITLKFMLHELTAEKMYVYIRTIGSNESVALLRS